MSNKVSHGYDIWYVRAAVLGRWTVSWIDVVNYLHVSTQLRRLPKILMKKRLKGLRPGIVHSSSPVQSMRSMHSCKCSHTTAACGSTGTSRLWFLGFGSIPARCHNWTWQVGFGPCLGPYYVTMLHGSMVGFLQALPHLGITAVILLDIMKCVLGLNGAWFLWGMSDASKRRCQRATHDSCKDLTQFPVFVACLLSQSLGLASCFQSVRSAGGGRPIWLLCKKPAWCLRGQATAASMLQESTWKSRVRVAKWHSQWYSQRQSLEPIGSADDKVQIDMAKMEEIAADGSVLGAGSNSKHSFNFATQGFTFGTPEETTIRGVSNGTDTPQDFAIIKVGFKSYIGGGDPDIDSELSIDAIVFQEDALLRFKGENGKNIDQPAPKGTVKFNVRMKQWNWCNNDCKCRQVSQTHHIDPEWPRHGGQYPAIKWWLLQWWRAGSRWPVFGCARYL